MDYLLQVSQPQDNTGLLSIQTSAQNPTVPISPYPDQQLADFAETLSHSFEASSGREVVNPRKEKARHS